MRRITLDHLIPFLTPLVEKGLASVLLFSARAHGAHKDARGSDADDVDNVVVQAVLRLRRHFGDALYIAVDVCVCAYTSHGHCGRGVGDGMVETCIVETCVYS